MRVLRANIPKIIIIYKSYQFTVYLFLASADGFFKLL